MPAIRKSKLTWTSEANLWPIGVSCEAKAVSKDGKPPAGAAKAASIKKCEAAAAAAPSCADKAIDKNGKPLAGAAKDSFMKKCEADAAAKKSS